MDTQLQQLIRQWRSDQSPEAAQKIAAIVSRPSDIADDGPKYCLSMSENHAQTILDAVDIYSRIQCGQLHTILDPFRFRVDISADRFHLAEDAIRDYLKPRLFPGLPNNASHGIRSPEVPQSAKMAYDLHQVIRHRVAWDRTEASDEKRGPGILTGGVWHYTPSKTASHPLAKMDGQTCCPCENTDCPK